MGNLYIHKLACASKRLARNFRRHARTSKRLARTPWRLASASQRLARASQMLARAELAVFWPGIYSDIEATRANCHICRVNAPSNPKLPPHEQPDLDFPFQQICADYMTLNGIPYLVTVDRLTGWPYVRRSRHNDAGANGTG